VRRACGDVHRKSSLLLASETTTTPAAESRLISFLKAMQESRMSRGIRFPQW
jgi:hypothetical protein